METLKQYLRDKNLSVEQFADSVKLHRATVYRHLKGQKFNLEAAQKYAEALNVPIESLCQKK